MNERPRSIGLFALCLGLTVAGSFFSAGARADNFGRIYYDKKTGQLVVTMIYRGTNPNHQFSLKWGECQPGDLPSVTAEVLDDQFNDLATTNFKKTVRFDLSDMPCARPASVSLRTAPRFFYTLTIPG